MLVLTMVGCEDKTAHELSFEVSFACPDEHDLADRLTLRVVRGGCDGAVTVMEQTLQKGESARALNGITAGVYGLEATALSESSAIASGCVEVSLPFAAGAETPAILLRSDSCDGPPPGEDAGQAPGDAGLDASANAASDAWPSTDAGDTGPRTCNSDCSDPFACTDDRCVDGQCVHEPFTGSRECDGIACTQGDQCEQGTCRAGKPSNAACADDGNPCTVETCEAESGCNRDNAEGTACNDQIGCTGPDLCHGGICRGTDSCGASAGICSAATGMCTACTSAADCDDRDPCTNDSCSAGACKYVNNTASCNDGKSCTNNDVCNNRVCAGTSTCPSDAACGGSSCKCNDSSKVLCSNTCVVLATSNQNCGQCGRVCSNGGSCQNSACKPSTAGNCTAYRYGGHDYLMCNDGLNWAAARDRCRSFGFGLAIIDNQAENDFLRTRPNAVDRWIGANDRGDGGRNCTRDQEEGAWYWSDPNSSDENFRLFCSFASQNATTCTAENGAYQNWSGDNPDNASCDCRFFNCSEGQDCGVFQVDGTWDDAQCNLNLAFICETP